MKHCAVCRTIHNSSQKFCSKCGAMLTDLEGDQLATDKRWTFPLLIVGSVAALGLVLWIIAIVAIRNAPERAPVSPPLSPSPVSTASAAPSAAPSATRSTAPQSQPPAQGALASFRKKLMSLPESDRLILSVESSSVPGVARVQVSNLWFEAKPYQRRQITQMMANLWSAEMQGKTAILHIYDISGREVAGTRAFGGIWTEDE